MKLFQEPLGRKFIGLIVILIFLLIGLILVEKMKLEDYEIYARWIVIAYGIFVTGNAGITVSSLMKNKK